MTKKNNYQDFFAKIDKNYNSFSKNELKLATFFRENIEMILTLSIVEIAEQMDVSKATVSRFIRKLSYDNFNEFRYSLRDTQKSITGEATIAESSNFVNTLKNDYNILIDRAATLIQKNDVDYFVSKITKSTHIYAAGIGHSGLSATEMASKFIHLGISIKPLNETSFITLHAHTLKPNDLFIVFSMQGENKQLLKAMELAKQKEATIILITNFESSTLSTFADCVLLTAQKSDLNNMLTISPQFPQLFLIDILFNAMIASNPKKYTQTIQNYTKNQWKNLDNFATKS